MQQMSIKWFAILAVAGGVVLWFGGMACFELWGYFRLKSFAPAQVERWEIKESSAKYFLEGTYKYEVDGKLYEGRSRLKEPSFLNRLSAEEELKRWEGVRWSVWYNPSAPQVSSLQKLFPYKRVIYAVLSLGLFVYFLLFPRLDRFRNSICPPKPPFFL
jgi:uncharacterized protein DUF3592